MKIDVSHALGAVRLRDVRGIRSAELLGIQYPRKAVHADICYSTSFRWVRRAHYCCVMCGHVWRPL